MLNPSSGIDLARALTNKLAGDKSLLDIINWWISTAWDSGYLESVSLDQLSWIELAATDIACPQGLLFLALWSILVALEILPAWPKRSERAFRQPWQHPPGRQTKLPSRLDRPARPDFSTPWI
jgi:hypothetical protein